MHAGSLERTQNDTLSQDRTKKHCTTVQLLKIIVALAKLTVSSSSSDVIYTNLKEFKTITLSDYNR